MMNNKEDYFLTENSSISLNIIRTIASQMVIIGHGISFMGILLFLQYPNFPWFQNIAVIIFFLLSGFLISFTSYKKKSTDYKFTNFFIDRFSRIFIFYIPALFFIILFNYITIQILHDITYENNYNLNTFINNIFMLQDTYPITINIFGLRIFGLTSFGDARPLWTINVVWWIYMVFGWCLLGRKNHCKIVWILGLIGFISLLLLVTTGARSNIKFLLLLSFLLGFFIMLIVNLKNKNLDSSFFDCILIILLIICLFLFLFPSITSVFQFCMFGAIILCIGLLFFLNKRKQDKNFRVSNWLNKIIIYIELKVLAFKNFLVKHPILLLLSTVCSFIIGFFYVYLTKEAYDPFFIIILALSFGLLLLLTNNSNLNFKYPKFIKKIAEFGSQYSFLLYLLHYSIFSIFVNFLGQFSPYLLFFIAYALSNIISIFLTYYIEKRYKAFRNSLQFRH